LRRSKRVCLRGSCLDPVHYMILLGSKYAANLILDAEQDEVLVDSRGLGSFQRWKKVGIGGGYLFG
jgi:hypothetical protein